MVSDGLGHRADLGGVGLGVSEKEDPFWCGVGGHIHIYIYIYIIHRYMYAYAY